MLSLLQELDDWTSPCSLRDRCLPQDDVAEIAAFLERLRALGFVESDTAPGAESGWDRWSPEAAFFHFATKDVPFPADPLAVDEVLRARAATDPPPPPTKSSDGPRRGLPTSSLPMEAMLKARRTWRCFADAPVAAADLGTLLRLTFKVQVRAVVEGQGEVVLKTSPSGGARHAIEAYVLAWNVDGLAAGAYHYDAATDELVDLGQAVDSEQVSQMLAHQTYFGRAAAAVVMCPVFARAMWRYPHSRAYRSILIEAGHLGQTFCLIATALGLAPFTTMAFSESAIEALLRLDGVHESPIYVVGIGTRDGAALGNPGAVIRGETP